MERLSGFGAVGAYRVITQGESVEIRLSQSEALVLFEWLARFDGVDGRQLADQAEQQVLWKLEGQLESVLVEVLSADYQERLVEAKKGILQMFG